MIDKLLKDLTNLEPISFSLEEIETENGLENFLLIKLIHAKHSWLDKLFRFLTIDEFKSVKDFPAIKHIIKENKPDMFSIKYLKDFDKSKKKYHLIKLFYNNDVYERFNELSGEINKNEKKV